MYKSQNFYTSSGGLPPERITHASYRKGASVFTSGKRGPCLRVVSGLIRLDVTHLAQTCFAGLALPGDVIGIESLLHGEYRFSAHALTPCVLTPWIADSSLESIVSLLKLLEASQQRGAASVALRCGTAEERICRLLEMIRAGQVDDNDSIVIPSLRDISEITDMTAETCSRIICRLRRQGYLGARSKGTIKLAWPLPASANPSLMPAS